MIKKYSVLKKGFSSVPMQEDIVDAVQYIEDVFEINRETLLEKVSKEPKIELMPPEDFIDDPIHFGRNPRGWLKEIPEEEWAEELQSEYSRNFEHILEAYNKGILAPGIQIEDNEGYPQMGDGRGRAIFSYCLDIYMKVATYV